MLMSSAASLRLGLPYAFRTPDLHFVLGLMQQAPGGIPGHLRVSKVYYNPDIQAILDELEDAEAFGDGAANEWRKGLMSKGQAAIADASRWEKWESQLRFGADIPSVLREYDLASFPRYVAQQQARSMTATAPAVVGIGSAYAPRHGMNGKLEVFLSLQHACCLRSSFLRQSLALLRPDSKATARTSNTVIHPL